MWFKNALIYKLSSDFHLDLEQLESQLEAQTFTPCGKRDTHQYGWVPALGDAGSQLAHIANSRALLCAKQEEKVLPAAVVRELVDERVAQIEAKEERKVYRKERDSIKEEVLFDALPQAFTRSSRTYAYLDNRAGWLLVDAASNKKAEALCSLLRESLGSLPAVPVQTALTPSQVMTLWLRGEQAPEKLEIGDECELREAGEDGSIVRCKRQDLFGDEISSLLDNGKQVHKLAVEWDEKIKMLLNEDLSLKRLKFSDTLLGEAEDAGSEDKAAKLDADFAIMSTAFDEFLSQLLDYFGGEKPEAI